jgi:putative ABC transport system permease protein
VVGEQMAVERNRGKFTQTMLRLCRTLWAKIPSSRLRFAARTLWRNPRFTFTVLAVLSLGIGTVSALFSVIDKVLLEPLPYPQPDRLVQIITSTRIGNQSLVSIPKYVFWRSVNASSFASMAASDVNVPELNFEEGAYRSTLKAARVSADYFRVFGAEMMFGRTFSVREDTPGGPNVVVISNEVWQRYFRSEAIPLGARMFLNAIPYTVVGVLAGDAHLESSAEVWFPLCADPRSADFIPRVRVIARMRNGISVEQAQNVFSSAIDWSDWKPPKADMEDVFTSGFSKVIPLRDAVVGDVRPSLYILMGAAGFMLAICCLNVATLFLARSGRRTREIAVRLALGASRKHVALEFLTESLLLSLGIAVGALLLGHVGVHAVLAMSPDELSRLGGNGSSIALDWTVFAFTLLVSLVMGILCALVPAVNASRTNISVLANDSAARSGMTIGRNRWRAALVIVEMSLSLVLLVGAGLLMRTFVAKRAINRGFDEQNVVTLDMSLNSPRFDKTAEVGQLIRYTERQIKTIPGVNAAATTNALPLLAGLQMPFAILEHAQVYGRFNGTATWRSVSPEYFKVFQIRVMRGRMFTDDDNENSARVVLINRAMMHKYWIQINANPIGDFIQIGRGWEEDPPRQIVGVVVDVNDAGLDRDPSMYIPAAQVSDWMNARNNRLLPLVWTIRTDEAQSSLIPRLQQELISFSGGQPVARPVTMHEALAASSARYEFYVSVLTLFGAIALVLAASGIYGLMTYSVQRRRKELAIRAAFGATPLDVQAMVVKQALRLTLYGFFAGIPLALVLTQATVSSIFGIQSWDPMTLVIVTLLLCAVSFFAAYLPSLRASHVDPVEALRFEA